MLIRKLVGDGDGNFVSQPAHDIVRIQPGFSASRLRPSDGSYMTNTLGAERFDENFYSYLDTVHALSVVTAYMAQEVQNMNAS